MVAEADAKGVAYRFVLSPGAKLSDVRMRWNGATELRLTDDARGVDVLTAIGTLRIRGLHAFTVDGSERHELPAHHVLEGDELSISVDGWDGRLPLVIDPTIAWSSYLGGAMTGGFSNEARDYGRDVAIDAAGNVFVTGLTESTLFPLIGAFDTTRDGTFEAFITKITNAGTIVWSSYLGGSGDDRGFSVALDASGAVFMTGDTYSTDFPSSGGFDTTLGGTEDAFVAKVSNAGALLWSSYLGGSALDFGGAIAVDPSGNALLAGTSTSTDFPKSKVIDTSLGQIDVIVAKISTSGSLVWSTAFGSAGDEFAYGIAADASGNAVITGSTNWTDFPIVAAYDATLNGGRDAFLTKLDPTGSIVWSTYFGGLLHDDGNDLAIDAAGNIVVVGLTESPDFPSTGGFDASRGGTRDGFVTKFNASGSPVWSSYLGGGANDLALGVALDDVGNLFVTGETLSSDFPSTGGFDTTFNGAADAYVAKVSSAGVLLWSSFLGGTSNETGNKVAVDGSGRPFVVGSTTSSDFPSSGGFDTTLGGTWDVFITKLDELALGATCTTASQCRSSLCVDGVCCDKPCGGICEACSAAKKGAGTSGSCGPVVDGSDPDVECPAQSCASATVTNAQVCNGAGACRANGTTPCGPYACAGTACGTTCSSDSGCIATAFCNGTACTSDLDVGAACVRASQCKSGFCADGVCCDRACSGACEACSAAFKGSGTDGTCANVPADTDPRSACPVGTGTCAADGLCDGAGSCRSYAKAGTTCGATTCTAGSVTGRICKGDSNACIDDVRACAPYACGAMACKTACTADSDCEATAFCTTTGACKTKLANGDACGAARECASNFCVDSVCCNGKCDGQCESCAVEKGTCKPVSGAPPAGRAKCSGEGTTCGGSCDGVNGGSCAYPAGKECSAKCTAAQQTIGKCDNAGACVDGPTEGCNGFACGTDRCKTACATNADCAEKFSCKAGICEPAGARCSDDGLSVIDADGKVVSCGITRCKGNKCVESCSATDECAPGYVCNVTTGKCEAPPPAASADEGGGCGCRTAGSPSSGALAALALGIAMLARRRR